MVRSLENEILRSRVLLQNPYAYLDGKGQYDAISHEKKLGIHEVRRVLQNQYAYLDGDGGYSQWSSAEKSTIDNMPLIELIQINKKKGEGKSYSRKVIEKIARRLQREMWFRQSTLFPGRKMVDALDILDPLLALECVGYSVKMQESVGQYSGNGELFEVAGVLDSSKGQVQISRRFSPEICNFTTAHELGHAVLHGGEGLHRDRALDGSPNKRPRSTKEVEADIFAAYFLLPEKQVRLAFQKIFLTKLFLLDEDTAFALTSGSLESLENRCRTLRDLTRMLASAERYNGVQVRSLANQFKVSVEAMAIRLEELNLVEV